MATWPSSCSWTFRGWWNYDDFILLRCEAIYFKILQLMQCVCKIHRVMVKTHSRSLERGCLCKNKQRLINKVDIDTDRIQITVVAVIINTNHNNDDNTNIHTDERTHRKTEREIIGQIEGQIE